MDQPQTGPADQAWFWTPEWQTGERDATAQIEAGDVEVFETNEALLNYLTS